VDEIEPGAGRVSLRERNRQRLTKRIVGAATELFRTVGYEQTTMDAIAEKAEVSRGTLFNYFPAKDALLVPYAKELYQQHIQPAMRSYLETQPTTLQALQFFLVNIHEQILMVPGMDRAFQQELVHSHSHSHKRVSKNGTGFLENMCTILAYGQQRAEVRTDIPLEKLARYVGALCASLLFSLMAPTISTEYKAEIAILLAFMKTGLAPD